MSITYQERTAALQIGEHILIRRDHLSLNRSAADLVNLLAHPFLPLGERSEQIDSKAKGVGGGLMPSKVISKQIAVKLIIVQARLDTTTLPTTLPALLLAPHLLRLEDQGAQERRVVRPRVPTRNVRLALPHHSLHVPPKHPPRLHEPGQVRARDAPPGQAVHPLWRDDQRPHAAEEDVQAVAVALRLAAPLLLNRGALRRALKVPGLPQRGGSQDIQRDSNRIRSGGVEPARACTAPAPRELPGLAEGLVPDEAVIALVKGRGRDAAVAAPLCARDGRDVGPVDVDDVQDLGGLVEVVPAAEHLRVDGRVGAVELYPRGCHVQPGPAAQVPEEEVLVVEEPAERVVACPRAKGGREVAPHPGREAPLEDEPYGVEFTDGADDHR